MSELRCKSNYRIGSDIYGLRDKPLQPSDPAANMDSACSVSGNNTHCSFTFIAPTESVRNARNFLVRDPAWDNRGAIGPIALDPAFDQLEATAKRDAGADDSQPASDNGNHDSAPKLKPQPRPAWFRLSGTSFSSLASADTLADDVPASNCQCEKGCLQSLSEGADGSTAHVPSADIKYAGDNSMWLRLTQPVGIHIFWTHPDHAALEWDLVVKKDEKTAITADPPILYVADCPAVTFTGTDFSSVKQVRYENRDLGLPVPPTKSKLVVQVTSDITAKFGHKELLATVMENGKERIVVLLFEVVKH